MAGRGFFPGRGDALKKHFERKAQLLNQEPEPTGSQRPGIGRGQIFQPVSTPDERSPSAASISSRPFGRGHLFAQPGVPSSNGFSHPPQNGHLNVRPSQVGDSRSSGQNGVSRDSGVPSSTPAVPPGGGRGSFLQKFQNDLKRAQSSTSSSSVVSPCPVPLSQQPSPPDSDSPESLLSDLTLSDSSSSSAPLTFRGETGQKFDVVTNYVGLEFKPGSGIYQYAVQFQPEVDAKHMRRRLLRNIRHITKDVTSFDGATLYLPFKLPNNVTEEVTEMDKTKVSVKIMFVKHMRMGDKECVHLYNVLFRTIMNVLGFVEHGRNFYDPNRAVAIHQHRLTVWPGVITAIQEYEGGVMLLCDASHRVLRQQTVLELMEDIIERCRVRGADWQNEFTTLVAGQTVLTRYNNKTYRIDDVDFSKTPRHVFTKNGEEISYVEYYYQQYQQEITDKGQPLLVSRVKTKVRGETVENFVDLIPELCNLSGITDTMRSDFQVMKDIATHTRISPAARQMHLENFLKTVNETPEARRELEKWGLKLASKNLTVEGRVLPPETIYAANRAEKHDHNCDWTRHVVELGVISAIHLVGWSVVCTRNDEGSVRDLVSMFRQVSQKMGIRVSDPEFRILRSDKIGEYVDELRRLSGKQIVVVVLPVARTDKYQTIKKTCCITNPIPSQVIISRTIRNSKRLRSVAQKILMQMNCKLGGTLWAVQIPLKDTMVIGLDTYHDPTRKGNSVGAVVASLNQECTRWFSRIYRQDAGRELIDGFDIAVAQCLKRFMEPNGQLPGKIVIYRDGTGDGDLETCSRYELPQLKSACKRHFPGYEPEVLFVVVQKRIHTRIFVKNRGREVMNAAPGTVLDHTVTRRDRQDFFLVSQNVTQGTVTPTHYVILNNTTKLTPDKVQRFTYKLTHLYYNWTGTIRVPAPCQYAHKLAGLAGEHLGGKEADDSLRDKLFYL